jgi:competence CoiA-like predicted nuclease
MYRRTKSFTSEQIHVLWLLDVSRWKTGTESLWNKGTVKSVTNQLLGDNDDVLKTDKVNKKYTQFILPWKHKLDIFFDMRVF